MTVRRLVLFHLHGDARADDPRVAAVRWAGIASWIVADLAWPPHSPAQDTP